MSNGTRVGEISHFFKKISVAVVQLEAGVSIGDQLHFRGTHTDFRQVVESMQIEHEEIQSAAAGQEVAIQVKERVRPGDAVLLSAEG